MFDYFIHSLYTAEKKIFKTVV